MSEKARQVFEGSETLFNSMSNTEPKKHIQEHVAAPHVESHMVYDVVWPLTLERKQMLA